MLSVASQSPCSVFENLYAFSPTAEKSAYECCSQSFIIGKMLLADRGFAVTKLAGRSGFEDVQRGEKHGNLRKA
jgi:hypothetical protein